MAAIKLKWWMLDSGNRLFAVPVHDSDLEGEGAPHSRGIVLAGNGAIREFSYRCHSKLFVDSLPTGYFEGMRGNCRMILERDFGKARMNAMHRLTREMLMHIPDVYPVGNIYMFEQIGFGHSTSGSGGRVVETAAGADLTLS
ncbi:hypothetical protein J7K50_06345 [bacterium]|nr:hypothetical protein [bacterium]